MPTVYPIEWVPPAVTGYYKHLMRRDVAVWERWLAKHGPEFFAVAYDVAIGGSTPTDPEISEADRLGWQYTTALKIDVLLLDVDQVWCVEVKPGASISALGAAVGYPLLLARDEPDLVVAGGGIVCEHLPPDIEDLAIQLNIRTWVV